MVELSDKSCLLYPPGNAGRNSRQTPLRIALLVAACGKTSGIAGAERYMTCEIKSGGNKEKSSPNVFFSCLAMETEGFGKLSGPRQ